MKVVLIGNNHAGTAFADNVLALNPGVDVVSYERNDNISFLACGIALWVGGVVEKPQGLFYSSSEQLAKKGVRVHMKHEVLAVDFAKKIVKVKNLSTGEEFEDSYDKLVLAAGSWPNTPKIPGRDLEGVFLAKTYQHAEQIIQYAQQSHVKHVTVVGSGYIGVELLEAFRNLKKDVMCLEGNERPLINYFDPEFTGLVEEKMREHGVDFHAQEVVQEITGAGKVSEVKTNKGTYKTDMVILATGFVPNTSLYKDYLETLPNGAIIVNEYMQTSDPNVYACGDCAAVLSNVEEGSAYIALATNAVRMGILCAHNIAADKVAFDGVQGSNAIQVFDLHMASTGYSEYTAKSRGFDVKSSFITDAERPEFMPSHQPVKVKVVYDAKTRRLLGAQIQSLSNHTEAIHMFSLAIQKKMTVDELALSDFFFLPHYNKPVSWLTQVCLLAQ